MLYCTKSCRRMVERNRRVAIKLTGLSHRDIQAQARASEGILPHPHHTACHSSEDQVKRVGLADNCVHLGEGKKLHWAIFLHNAWMTAIIAAVPAPAEMSVNYGYRLSKT
eukprot:COSAG01_NODE_2489_length_7588_cov_3.099880_7_plen_110_part_00